MSGGTQREDVDGCESCGWPTADLRPVPVRDERLNVFLCDVCYRTHASAPVLYRRGATLDDICGTVAWGINAVLAEVRSLRPEGQRTYVAEGWWHPNVKSGQVHEHPENPGGGWSAASHRLCESVYTRRAPQ